MTKVKILFIGSVLLFMSACSKPVQMYAGPKQSNDILLRANISEVTIDKIDNKATAGKLFEEDYNILEGRHSVTARLHYEIWMGSAVYYVDSPIKKTTCFKAERGKKYVALAKPTRGSDDWEFLIREFGHDDKVNYPCH